MSLITQVFHKSFNLVNSLNKGLIEFIYVGRFPFGFIYFCWESLNRGENKFGQLTEVYNLIYTCSGHARLFLDKVFFINSFS